MEMHNPLLKYVFSQCPGSFTPHTFCFLSLLPYCILPQSLMLFVSGVLPWGGFFLSPNEAQWVGNTRAQRASRPRERLN